MESGGFANTARLSKRLGKTNRGENKTQYSLPRDLFDSVDVTGLWRSNLLSRPHYSGGQTALAFSGSFLLQTSNYLWQTENAAVKGLFFFQTLQLDRTFQSFHGATSLASSILAV